MTDFSARKGQVLAAIGLLGLAVACLVLAVVLVGRGAPATSSASLPQETETPTPGASPTESAPDLATTDFQVSTYEVFLARDPFEPVVPEPAAGGGGNGGNGVSVVDPDRTGDPTTSPTGDPTTSPTSSPTTSPTTQPTANPTASPDPTESPSGCVADGAVVCDGHTVKLVDVFEASGAPAAAVQVDNVLHEVTAGETFAQHFEVRSIDDACVTLLYGDDAFTLCEGESVLK